MRFGILSRGPRLFSTRRLVDEGRARGLDVRVVDPLLLTLGIADDDLQVTLRGHPIHFDAVLPRIGYSITRHGVAVLRHFERQGVTCVNSSQAVLRSRDKLHATQALSRHGITMPRTVYVRDPRDIDSAIQRVGGESVVVKVTEGTQGNGVILCHNPPEARRIVEAMLRTGVNVIIQQYIRESHGTDVRMLVVGDEVVAAMRRRSRGDEFRSNYHLNGTVERFKPPEEYVRTALDAARILGLNVAGVDLLDGRDGPLLLEVNSSPGLQGIEEASEVNVASKIIEYVIESSHFSPANLEPLMRSRKGHGVLRLPIPSSAGVVGKSLEAMFSDFESMPAFALVRHSSLIWQPPSNTLIEGGDELLCFGPLRSLRTYLSNLLTEKALELVSIDPVFGQDIRNLM